MQNIYEKYLIKIIYLYSVLIDADSICVFFIFICKPKCDFSGSQFKDVLFEVIKANRILERFDTSDKLWDRYSIGDKSLKKKRGRFSVKNISDPCLVTIAINPK